MSEPTSGRRGVEQGDHPVHRQGAMGCNLKSSPEVFLLLCWASGGRKMSIYTRQSAKINGIFTNDMPVPSLYEMARSAASAATELNKHCSTHEGVKHKQVPSPRLIMYLCNAVRPPCMASAHKKS